MKPPMGPNPHSDELSLQQQPEHVELTAEDEHHGTLTELNHRLDTWAQTHADSSEGRLITYKPGSPFYHERIRTYIKGDPQGPEFINGIAKSACPEYPVLRHRVHEVEQETGMFTDMYHRLNNGDKFVLVFGHEDLIDLALGEGAVLEELADIHQKHMLDLGNDPATETNYDTGIIVNTMLDRVGIDVLAGVDGADAVPDDERYFPTIEALSGALDYVFTSLPRTASGEKHLKRSISDDMDDDDRRFFERREQLIQARVGAHNKIVRGHISLRLQRPRKGFLLSVSPGGSMTTESVMARVNTPTANMLHNRRTYLLPMAIGYGDGIDPFLEVPQLAQPLSRPEDIHDLMRLIAATKNKHLPDMQQLEYPDDLAA